MTGTSTSSSCENCRWHRKEERLRVIREVLDTIAEVEDDNALHFLCMAPQGPHAGKEVGLLPVLCPSHESPAARDNKATDDSVARAMARLAARSSRQES